MRIALYEISSLPKGLLKFVFYTCMICSESSKIVPYYEWFFFLPNRLNLFSNEFVQIIGSPNDKSLDARKGFDQ